MVLILATKVSHIFHPVSIGNKKLKEFIVVYFHHHHQQLQQQLAGPTVNLKKRKMLNGADAH